MTQRYPQQSEAQKHLVSGNKPHPFAVQTFCLWKAASKEKWGLVGEGLEHFDR